MIIFQYTQIIDYMRLFNIFDMEVFFYINPSKIRERKNQVQDVFFYKDKVSHMPRKHQF